MAQMIYKVRSSFQEPIEAEIEQETPKQFRVNVTGSWRYRATWRKDDPRIHTSLVSALTYKLKLIRDEIQNNLDQGRRLAARECEVERLLQEASKVKP